ncbi:hypothetical protein PInf_014091 [Phytophthora infestans]|nr:hypothetical protein PInf_014091 [Phytophthora infestans]
MGVVNTQTTITLKLEVKIARELRDGTLKAPRIAPFDSSEADQDGYASFERTNGAFTASWAGVEEEDAESEEKEFENEDGPDGVDGKDARGYESSSGESGAGGKRPVKRLHLSRSPPPKSKKSAKRSTSRSRSLRRSYKRKSRSRQRERSLTPERPPFPKHASGKCKASISYSERSRSPTPVKKKSRRTLSPKRSRHPSQSRSRSASPEKKKSRRIEGGGDCFLETLQITVAFGLARQEDSTHAFAQAFSIAGGGTSRASRRLSASRSSFAKETKKVSSPKRSPHRSLSPPPEPKKPEGSPDKQTAEAPSATKKTSESPEERAESHSPSPKKATVSPDRSSSKSPPSKKSA